MRVVSKSLSDTEVLAAKLLRELEPNKDKATVLGFVGDLGSGKTTFVQALARQLGIAQAITSPTFVIEKRYKLNAQPWGRLVHIDAYRFNQPEEMLALEWEQTLADPQNLVIVEWADRIGRVMPAGARRLEFKFIDESRREIAW